MEVVGLQGVADALYGEMTRDWTAFSQNGKTITLYVWRDKTESPFTKFTTVWEYMIEEAGERYRRTILGPTDMDEYIELMEKLAKNDVLAIDSLFKYHELSLEDNFSRILRYNRISKEPYIEVYVKNYEFPKLSNK